MGTVGQKQENKCHKCGDKWFRGHQCQQKGLHLVEAEEGAWPDESTDEEDKWQQLEDEPNVDITEHDESEGVQVSLHAIGEVNSIDLIKIKGEVHGFPIIALVDSGSTHSFISPKVIQKIGIIPEHITPMSITVANGAKMQCKLECKDLKWKLQDQEFQFNLKVMDMGVYEMLLGGDWMRSVGPVLLDFKNLTLGLRRDSKKLKFQGVGRKASVRVIVGQELEPTIQKGELCFISQSYLLPTEYQAAMLPKSLHNLIDRYQDLFQEPKELPPPRNHDHNIPIKEGSDPVNLRPYRYSHTQKDEVEKIVEELLNASIIRPSSSPFASPALLVKKKDGTWRMCIDYRKLNSITIKNKYPIPIVDDLLDELKGAQIFSKIDLRSGYHQIRVKEEDVYKTAFRIHFGHFEFRVMPFGLTNAPASFQNLMNDVFKEELRKSVLVFFDDILVYSRNLEDHIKHLEKVFSKLRKHKLYAKMSKCAFGMGQVEYLGHIITKDGVATDPSKIEVMVNWPKPKILKELRGFLGLTGYYRKFIKSYGTISKPLTDQLKKNGFMWNESAEKAFEKLKQAMTSAPVLALPDFKKPFILETDACDIGVGVVLPQEGRPIAYLSKVLVKHFLSICRFAKQHRNL
ncbi:polyprotein [Rhynchospora pubera]|uniref:Polyprotein n=1 Tax=Rhynchospora pubera TaxID=906938 RepID=A0AAV8E6C3_9POAL|nr:polyprotein [Rhynchospora pubera]